VFPAVFLAVWLIIQLAMWAMAAQAVQAAAAAGGQSVRALGGDATQAQGAAQAALGGLGGLGGNMVTNTRVDVGTAGSETLVQVSGRVATVVPFFTVSVTGKSQAPRQQYRVSG